MDPVDPTGITLTSYQLGKYIKHTCPSSIYDINSVLVDGSLSAYENYLITASASGCLQLDDRGRKNLIYYAGEETGLQYNNGIYTMPCSGIKVAFCEDVGKIHLFPKVFHPNSRTCTDCGCPVPFNPYFTF
ncbi:MAG: hypothetical protein Q8O14_12975 [bacterium]|nr:hypothetical protein [bacterium]